MVAGQDTAATDAPASQRRVRTPWYLLFPVVFILPWVLSKLHYSLPAPQQPHDVNGFPQPSEEIVLGHIRELENIGYRLVGTPMAEAGEVYVLHEVNKIAERCDNNGVLDCTVWYQRGSGYHQFSLIDHDVLKVYAGIGNVILKIKAKNPPSGRPSGSNDSVLLGSHIDSTLPSPGAADDAIGVGVMLDIARILVDRNQPFDNSVIFMWNGAEETLQDGSHLYSTQHPSGKDVRAVINLEAAGTTGGVLLFQATSKEMIEAFKHAPYPRGTVIAADVFSSGIILSDTDFGQFEQYLGVTGLDMAIVGHSYYYHTHKDIVANIETGSAQHFSSNVMAIVDHLLSSESPLTSHQEWSPPDVVFLSLYDRIFLSWTMKNADFWYIVLFAFIGAISFGNLRSNRLKAFAIAVVGAPLGLVAGLLCANAVAGLMVLLNRKMAWFSHEGLPVALYGPAGVLGHLGLQHLLGSLISPLDRAWLENAHYYAQIITLGIYMLILQSLRIRSAYVFGGIACTLLVGAVTTEVRKLVGPRRMAMPFTSAYILPLIFALALAMEAYTTTLDIFVPLTGRMGKEAPVEFIIATITSACTLIFFPIVVPLFHRLSRPGQRTILSLLFLTVVCVILLFSAPWWSPYDSTHPKRMGLQYTYNHTDGQHTAHLAYMDSSDNKKYARHFHEHFGQSAELVRTDLSDYDSDWDTLYPVSTFLDTYRFPLAATSAAAAFVWPQIGFEGRRTKVSDGVYNIHLSMDHTGLVWPVLAFEADLIDWSFDFEPPRGKKRHHIKGASSVNENKMDLELTVRMAEDEKIVVHWSAIDLKQMVPATALTIGEGQPASVWLLEAERWAKEEYNDSIDLCANGIVVGLYEI